MTIQPVNFVNFKQDSTPVQTKVTYTPQPAETTQEPKEEGLSDTAKVAIGVGIAAVAALAIYALTRKPGAAQKAADNLTEGAKDALGKGGSDTASPVEGILRRAEESAEKARLGISSITSDTVDPANKATHRTPKSARNAAKAAMKKAAKKAAKKEGKPFLPEGVVDIKKEYGDTDVYLSDGRRILISPIGKEKNIRYYDRNGIETLWLKKVPGRRGIKKVTGRNPIDWPTIYEGQEVDVGKGVIYNVQLDKVLPISGYWVGTNGKSYGLGTKDYRATVHI